MFNRNKKKALTLQTIENTLFQNSYNHRSKIIEAAEFLGEQETPNLEDSGVYIPPIDHQLTPQEQTAQLYQIGIIPSEVKQQDNYASIQQSEDLVLADFGF